MGGFGTLKIALRYPERFLAACPIASAVQLTNQYVHHRTDEREWFGREFEKIFGHYEHPEELLGSEEDCYWLLDQALEQKKRHYEGVLQRELDGLDDEFSVLKFLSQELQVRANSIRSQRFPTKKAA